MFGTEVAVQDGVASGRPAEVEVPAPVLLVDPQAAVSRKEAVNSTNPDLARRVCTRIIDSHRTRRRDDRAYAHSSSRPPSPISAARSPDAQPTCAVPGRPPFVAVVREADRLRAEGTAPLATST